MGLRSVGGVTLGSLGVIVRNSRVISEPTYVSLEARRVMRLAGMGVILGSASVVQRTMRVILGMIGARIDDSFSPGGQDSRGE